MSDWNNSRIPCSKNTCHDVTDPYAKRSFEQADPARKILDLAWEQPSQTNNCEKDHDDKC